MSLRVYSAQKYSTRSYNNGTNPTADPATGSVFLLKCDAGNTFADIGPNAYSITNIGGNVTASNTVAKFSNTYSAQLNGYRLIVADAAALRPGTGSFTWEFWWYPTNLSGYRTPLAKGYNETGSLIFQTGSGDGKLTLYSAGSPLVTANTAVTVNTWNHVAAVRNGTAIAIYINGTSAGTGTSSVNINSTSDLGIGDASNASGYPANGYMQDVRLSSLALYTANFTPPGSLS